MANPFDIANFNLTNFANIYPDVMDSDPKTVEYTYKDANGNIKTKNVENRGLFKKHIWDDVGGALGQFDRTFYVDAENGDDNNEGSSSAPFKTIKKAVDSVSVGGKAYLYTKGNFDFNEIIIATLKYINITNVDDEKKDLTFKVTNDGKYNRLCNFRLIAGLTLRKFNIKFDLTDLNDDLPYKGDTSIQSYYGETSFPHNLFCIDCEVYLPDNNNIYVFQSNGYQGATSSIALYNTTIDTQDNSVFAKITNGTMILNDFSHNITGSKSTLEEIVTGIIKDSDSGNPINLLSNYNFSD